ncbi:MAG: holin [Burkholderia gladioli]
MTGLIAEYLVANGLVLSLSIFLTLNQRIETGLFGTLGLSMIGVAAAVNVFKPAWDVCAVDGPEALMLTGMAVSGLWFVASALRKRHE